MLNSPPTPLNAEPSPAKLVAVTIPTISAPSEFMVTAVPTLN